MKEYHYIVKASTGDNVGVIEADSEEDALSKLEGIYAPPHPRSGEPHALIDFEIITAAEHDKQKQIIEAKRKAEAEA